MTSSISIYYIIFNFTGNVAYYVVMALFITIFTNNLGYSPLWSSNIHLIIGILGVILAYIILEKLTLKNDYINLSIKYVGRLIVFALAFLFPYKILVLIALCYCGLTSPCYSHVSDAPYVNRFNGKDQLIFCNLKEMSGYFARSIGTFLCGVLIVMGLKFNFFIAFVFVIIQIVFGFLALNLRLKEKEKV